MFTQLCMNCTAKCTAHNTKIAKKRKHPFSSSLMPLHLPLYTLPFIQVSGSQMWVHKAISGARETFSSKKGTFFLDAHYVPSQRPLLNFSMLHRITCLYCGRADLCLHFSMRWLWSFHCSFLRHMHARIPFLPLYTWKENIARNTLNVAADGTTYWQGIEIELTLHFSLSVVCQGEIKGIHFLLHIVLTYTPSPFLSLQGVPHHFIGPQGVPRYLLLRITDLGSLCQTIQLNMHCPWKSNSVAANN